MKANGTGKKHLLGCSVICFLSRFRLHVCRGDTSTSCWLLVFASPAEKKGAGKMKMIKNIRGKRCCTPKINSGRPQGIMMWCMPPFLHMLPLMIDRVMPTIYPGTVSMRSP